MSGDHRNTNAPQDQAERYGLFRLYPGPEVIYNPLSFETDIVAIHGLGGHAFKTWTDKNGHLWLRDSLPSRIPKIRVMTFGYNSTVFFGSSGTSINDFATDLTTRLQLERQHAQERRRPLIFICHSLGGVVFKELLVHLSLQLDRGQDLVKSIFGVVFMGTPHRGSRAATPSHLLTKIINVTTLGNAVRSDLVRNLQVSSVELETISRHATELLKSLSIVSFYEQKPIGPTLIVESFSAILGLPNERPIPIDADHRKLAKVSPRIEQRYLPVWTAVKELVESSSMTLSEANRDLLNKLYCVDYKTARLRPRRPETGTCNWLFRDPTYVSWLNSPQPSMLLLAGQAGIGKSVLTRHLAESVLSGRQSEGPEIGYFGVNFFCSYDETVLNNEVAVLRSLLHQLIQLNVHTAAVVRSRLEKRNRTGTDISFDIDDLWGSLVDVMSMSTMSRVFLVVDAIEELGIEVAVSLLSNFLKTTQSLSQKHPESRLRIFVSCRHNPAYVSALPNLTVLSMNKVHVQQDIEQYLQHAINEHAAKNSAFRASISTQSRKEIVTRISTRVDGLFLQATLIWEDFRKGILWNQDILNQKLENLNTLPPGMEALYDRAISGFDDSIRDDAFSIFSIIASAVRPLSEQELGVILSFCYASSRPVIRSTDLKPFQDLCETMERHFPELVTIQDDNKVTFVHLSFKEYLQNRRDFHDILLSGRRKLTRACLKYLKLKDILHDAHNGLETNELFSRFAFLSYSRDYFLFHINGTPYDDSLWLLFSETAGESSVYTLDSLSSKKHLPCRSPLAAVLENVPTPAKFQLIRAFKEHGYDLNEVWSRRSCGSALQRCCSLAGYDITMKETAFLLLNLGVNPNLPPRPWRSNLRRSMDSGAWDLYEALLHHPLIDPNMPDENDQTMLHVLVQVGSFARISEIVDVLHDVDVNVQDSQGFTPLHLATSNGRADVVRKLLSVPGIRLDVVDKQGRTALTLATYWAQKKIALILIEYSQAFPVPESDQLSALVLAAQHGQKDLCFRLLNISGYRNVDFHIDLSGRGILHLAGINNWADLIAECIHRGAGSGLNVNKIDHTGKTPLHYTAALGNVEACIVLVNDGGANLKLQDRNGRTAAQAAADAGFKDVLVVLLRTGRLDPNQRDIEGRSLVHWMATIDCVDTMEMLDKLQGVVVDWGRRDKHGQRPVDIAARCQCKYVGLFLAERTPGGQIERLDRRFRSMYSSLTVEAVDDDALIKEEEDLQARNARRQKWTSDKEWEELHLQFPEEKYGLVHVETKKNSEEKV